jgi:hypothetical protein
MASLAVSGQVLSSLYLERVLRARPRLCPNPVHLRNRRSHLDGAASLVHVIAITVASVKVSRRGKVMAKSQLRSGREPKKPKKERVKVTPSSASLWSTLEKQPSHDANKKR